MEIIKLNNCITFDKLRPSMNYIKVTKNHMVATDANILVACDTSEILGKDFCDGLKEDEELYILGKDWSNLLQQKVESINLKNGILTVEYSSKTKMIKVHKIEDLKFQRYPNWEAVIKYTNEPIENIGVNSKLLHRLLKALPYTQIKLNFTGKNKAIRVTDATNISKSFGIIMPYIQ